MIMSSFSLVALLVVLLTTLPGAANGFNHLVNNYKNNVQQSLSSSSSSTTTKISVSSSDKLGPSSRKSRLGPEEKRRAFLTKLVATGITSTAALSYRHYNNNNNNPELPQGPPSSVETPPSTLVSAAVNGAEENTSDGKNENHLLSIDQAVMVIEASCDRRFLHAVVSSDYNLLYRGISESTSKSPATIVSEPSDLLLESTYNSKKALEYFQNLEDTIMADKPIKPSNGHLATTSINSAEQWGGYAASIWPLNDNDDGSNSNNVHFAWLEEEGGFWPPNKSSSTVKRSSVIIDGIDCGRLSLEDALEREDSEIMFSANRYLAIPISMDKQLISRLKQSFII